MTKFLLGVLIGILLGFLFVYFGGAKALKKVGENLVDTGKKTAVRITLVNVFLPYLGIEDYGMEVSIPFPGLPKSPKC